MAGLESRRMEEYRQLNINYWENKGRVYLKKKLNKENGGQGKRRKVMGGKESQSYCSGNRNLGEKRGEASGGVIRGSLMLA